MQVGVVGKPSVGKSTFFKAATLAEAEIANYPFTTIKPNTGIGYVKVRCAETHFNVKCNPREGFCIDGQRFVPVQMIDVAGLVPGAHEGLGMGNQFLDDLRQADALIHVIDIAGTTNEKGEQVDPGSYDPANDVKFLEEEIDYWYVGIMKRGWDKFAREIVQTKKIPRAAIAKQMSGLGVDEDMVEDSMRKLSLDPNNIAEWTEEQVFQLAVDFRKKTKPMIIACNKIDVSAGKANFERIKKMFPDYIMIPCSAESELALREAAKLGIIKYIPGQKDFEILQPEKLNEKQAAALNFIKTNILDVFRTTGVQETIDKAVFELLKYVAIFPGGVNKLEDQNGNVLPDCFLMPSGTTALDFAFRLHSDFGNKFIRAIDVKTKMTVGKEHLLKNGDVVEIVSGR
ncbi:redox-regulated ATPase YchF [Candidatus Woesearchaeota archaeon]|nr:redox-regulated ATPase YchF [Candidatus Woesearchaeota archaeon]